MAHVSLHRHAAVALHALLLGILLWCAALLGVVLWAAPPLNRNELLFAQNILILDRTGGVMGRFFDNDNRSFVDAQGIPESVRHAVIAIEDRRFFERRSCVDLRAIARAAFHNIRSDDVQGGSTLTQQLVRNLYLTPEKTYKRKVQELWLACRLERTLSRDEILTLYVNRVGFGGPVYGIEQAAQSYFGIPAKQLSIAQSAVLAAMPQEPSLYAPGGSRERTTVERSVIRALRAGTLTVDRIRADDVRVGLLGRSVSTKDGRAYLTGRADNVLSLMRKEGFITDAQAVAAQSELRTLQLRQPGNPLVAPHFALQMKDVAQGVLRSVEKPEQWLKSGMTVKTTIDPDLQRIAEESMSEFLPVIHAQGGRDAALVALQISTRDVLAYVGNGSTPENAQTAGVDMAAAPRQPGSSIKPLVYAFAFERGWTPDTFVDDTKLTIGTDTPKNYEGGFKGRMTVRQALAMSRNIPAIRAFLAFSDEDGLLAMMSNAGAPTPLEAKRQAMVTDPGFTYGWPIAIGSAEIPLIELTNAYATIAAAGNASAPRSVCSVSDRQGTALLKLPVAARRQAIAPAAALMVDDILRDASVRPQGLWRDVLTVAGTQNAAKTGTSNLCLQRTVGGDCLTYAAGNVWTVGYAGDIAVGVMVGNADNAPMDPKADGLTVAAPLWHRFLERALARPATYPRCG